MTKEIKRKYVVVEKLPVEKNKKLPFAIVSLRKVYKDGHLRSKILAVLENSMDYKFFCRKLNYDYFPLDRYKEIAFEEWRYANSEEIAAYGLSPDKDDEEFKKLERSKRIEQFFFDLKDQLRFSRLYSKGLTIDNMKEYKIFCDKVCGYVFQDSDRANTAIREKMVFYNLKFVNMSETDTFIDLCRAHEDVLNNLPVQH
jgi:hypothetical protein